MTAGSDRVRLSREDVEHVALLARLRVDPGEIELLREQLVSILDQIAVLGEVDVGAIAADAVVQPLVNVFRDDEPAAGLTLEGVLANAPAREDDQFRVPPVFDEP